MIFKKTIIKGTQWTTVSMVGTTTLQTVKLAVLARLLGPEELGLMAIVMIVVGFSQAFADMGMSSAIIQRQHITRVQLSSLYWLNIASGVLLTGILVGFSPLIATFFEQPDLEGITMAVASVFVLAAVGQQFRILCQKELQFRTIALVTVFAELVATSTAIYFAWTGSGVWALVYSLIVAAALTSFSFLVIGVRRHHKPSWVYNHRQLTGFYSFGFYQIGERSINYISANIDKILIGRMVGIDVVGFYNMASTLISLPLSRINPIVNAVSFPVYAKLQLEQERLEHYYTVSVKILSLITIPLLVFLFFFAVEIVLLVLGSGWDQTVILVQILAIVGLSWALGNPGGALILALGRANIGFWWNVFYIFLIGPCITVALWYQPSAESAAYTLLALSLVTGIIWHYLIVHFGKLSYWPIIRNIIKVLSVNILFGVCAKHIVATLGSDSNFLNLTVGGLIFCISYIGYLALVERQFLDKIVRSR